MGIIRDVKYTSNIIQNTGQGMETITVKLEDDNPLIPPKCSEVVVQIPAKYEQNLYAALGGVYSAKTTRQKPQIVFDEWEAARLIPLYSRPEIIPVMNNMGLETKLRYVQRLTRIQ